MPASARMAAAVSPFGPAPTTTVSTRSITTAHAGSRPECAYPSSPAGAHLSPGRECRPETVVWAAVALPLLVELEERRTERVIPHEGHGRPADRPIVRCQLRRLYEVAPRRLF